MGVTSTRIRRALEEAMAALDRLTELLAGERHLLGQGAPEKLQRLALDKRAVVAALEQANTSCRHALREAGYEGAPAQEMEHFLQRAADPELAALWQGFLTKLREVRTFNAANGLAIQRSQALIGAELRSLHGAPLDTARAVYDATGSYDYGSCSRIISSA